MSYRRTVLAVGLTTLAACDASFLHDVESRRDATDRGCPAPDDGAHDVAAVVESNGTLTVSWTSKATNAEGYLVERQSSREPTWGEIGTVTTLTFNDTRVNHDEEYGYRVSALRSAGTSVCATPASDPIAVRTSPNPGGSFLARGTAAGQITLTWSDVNTFEAGYRVARGASGGALAPLQTLGANTAQFIDSTVTPGTIYSYSLVAFNAGGDSTASIVLQRAVTPPTLAWTTPPFIGPQCTFEAGGSATYDSGATFGSASGVVGGTTIGGNASGPKGVIPATTSGSVNTSWTVDDSAGGESTLSRTLNFVKTSTPRARQRMAEAGEIPGEGMQALFPACATCGATQPTSLVAGSNFTCQVKANGHVSCWGGNDVAQLGNGKSKSARVAIRPCAFDGAGLCTGPRQLTQVSAGTESACGVTGDGHAICWGSGSYLQLGGPLPNDADVPVTVCATVGATDCTTTLTGVTQVSVGDDAACAIANGEVWCWGTDGSDGSTHVPAPVCTAAGPCTHFTADQVDVGNDVTCARRGDKMWCWGTNSSGTFGTDTTATSVYPVPVCKSGTGGTCSALTGVADIAVGGYTACARLSDGTHDNTLFCWGNNGSGQLGTGSANGAETVPTQVCISNTGAGCTSDLPPVGDFDVGNDHACARLITGEVYCWGDNFYSQLGSYSTSSSEFATPVCASGTGTLCPQLTGVTEVSVGYGNSCARRNDGHVVCWGATTARGNPEKASDDGVPVIVCTGGSGSSCDTLGAVTQIAAGDLFGCGLVAGELWCWGANDYGDIGIPEAPDSEFASEVLKGAGAGAQPLDQVRSIALGEEAACAVRTDGTVWCWGIDSYGILAVGPTGLAGARGYAAPVCKSGSGSTCVPLSGVVQVTVGVYHACAVTTAGELWCWGGDDCGEVGRGISITCDDTADIVSVPQRVCADVACNPLTNVVEAAAGYGVTCALRKSGDIVCFGDNRLGQVGAGSVSPNARLPVPVCDASQGGCVALSDMVAVRAGYLHVCAIRRNGGVACWGDDTCAQLGNPVRTTCTNGLKRTDARSVCADGGIPCIAVSDVVDVGVGFWHTCVLTSDGAVSCWGLDYDGQQGDNFFGDNVTAQLLGPVLQCPGLCGTGGCVTHLSGAVSLSAGDSHNCVTREDGIAYCWGWNHRNQTGSAHDGALDTCAAHQSCASGDPVSCVPNDAGDVRLCDALSVVVP